MEADTGAQQMGDREEKAMGPPRAAERIDGKGDAERLPAAAILEECRTRLRYVLKCSEESAHKTIDAVEMLFMLIRELNAGMQKDCAREYSRAHLMATGGSVRDLQDWPERMRTQLKDILDAQGFQDLAGQVILRTIEAVDRLETHWPADHQEMSTAHVRRPPTKTSFGPACGLEQETLATQADVNALLDHFDI
ncbi:MAG: protein phosphatase CheZ [Dehalococcoidia bacterium]